MLMYLPELDKVRRVSSAQRGDSFLGSDITYADLERLRSEDFVPVELARGERGDEATWVVLARPVRKQHYSRIEFTVAQADEAPSEAASAVDDAAAPAQDQRAGHAHRPGEGAAGDHDDVARRLWDVSEEMTGVEYDFDAAEEAGGD